MNDFAKNYAKQVRQDREDEDLAKQSFVQGEKLKDELGPKLWDKLRARLQANSEDINKEMGEDFFSFESRSSRDFKITTSSPVGHLTVEFDAASRSINFDYGTGTGEYVIDINENGEPFLRLEDPKRPDIFEIESTAQYLLECVIKSPL
jgi:hypothetical protein